MPELYKIQPSTYSKSTFTLISKLPILMLNIHSRCNCRCLMCDIWKRSDETTLHTADLNRHRESLQALGVEHVVLTGGEPLLNGEVEKIALFFRDLGIKTTLLTTGLLLLAKAGTIASVFDDIIVSIDGPSEVHDQVRRIRGSFDLIQKGVAAVRHNRPDMQISCRTTVQKLNHNHLRPTVSAAKLIQLNSISFLPADIYSEAFNRPQHWTEDRKDEIALTAEEVHALEREIELLIEAHQQDILSSFIVESETKLRRIAHRFRERIENIPPTAPLCNAPWVSSVVEVDGTVRPCFFHPGIGSLKHQTLQQVLNSKAAVEFRSSLDVSSDPTCRRCVCSLNYKGQI